MLRRIGGSLTTTQDVSDRNRLHSRRRCAHRARGFPYQPETWLLVQSSEVAIIALSGGVRTCFTYRVSISPRVWAFGAPSPGGSLGLLVRIVKRAGRRLLRRFYCAAGTQTTDSFYRSVLAQTKTTNGLRADLSGKDSCGILRESRVPDCPDSDELDAFEESDSVNRLVLTFYGISFIDPGAGLWGFRPRRKTTTPPAKSSSRLVLRHSASFSGREKSESPPQKRMTIPSPTTMRIESDQNPIVTVSTSQSTRA